MDDAGLVRLAAGGDRDAFAAIYDRYAARLHDFLCSVLRDHEEAADVLHDTFLVAGSRLHQLRDPSRLRPWLYAIARNRALRQVSRRRRHEPLGEKEVAAGEPEAAEMAVRDDLADLVRAAAEGLSARDRVVLDLHLRQGLEGQELADALGVTANNAYVMLSRLRDQVERSLGALLVARQGRKDCEDLAEVLAGWDGRFTTVWRKRVARHVDDCEVCSERRRATLSPAALLGVPPVVALPSHLRRRVLEDVELCGHGGRPWPASRGGFPPPVPKGRRRRWRAPAAAAAVLVAVGTTIAGESGDTPEPLADARATSASAIAGAAGAAGPTTTDPGAPALRPAPSKPTTAAAATTAPGAEAPATTTAGPDAPTTTASATTLVADVGPPTVTAPRADPPEIWAGGRCTPGTAFRPRRTSVTVTAVDPSGIHGITLEWGGPQPGLVAMTADPATSAAYGAAVGPFSEAGLPRGGSVTVPVEVHATDRAGNVATARGSFTLRCEPSAPS